MSGFVTSQPTLNPQETLANRSRNKRRQAQSLWDQLPTMFGNLGDWIWNNPLGFDPQAVVNEYGTSAGELFAFAGAYSNMVQTVTGTVPPSFVPSGWSAVTNADGTVTVTQAT